MDYDKVFHVPDPFLRRLASQALWVMGIVKCVDGPALPKSRSGHLSIPKRE